MAAFYRKDIDGLRAVAVLPVLFFHAGIAPFSGGYAGVDIFFVISGYLITQLILRESAAGGFSVVDFYDRRARRILPPLFVLLAAASIAAFVVLLPDELIQFGKYLLSAVTFMSNIFYWRQANGYFGPLATDNPLLHIWSLSVEEQFYLLWPVGLIWLGKNGLRAFRPHIIAVLAIVSFAAALWAARYQPNASFYLLPTRAWELLVGALLTAANPAPLRGAFLASIAAMLGLASIAFAVAGFGEAMPFPGWNSISAVLGTILLLHAGNQCKNPVSAALGSAVPAFIGKISYSLYLWHWPLLVFARLYAGHDLALLDRCLLLVLAAVVSVLSWLFVEQPIRRRKVLSGPATGFAAAAGLTVLLGGIAAIAWLGQGLPQRLSPNVQALVSDAAATADNAHCLEYPNGQAAEWRPTCLFGATHSGGEAVVLGDSHADALFPGLLDFAADHRLTLRDLAYASCSAIPGLPIRNLENTLNVPCGRQSELTLRAILQSDRVRLVILHGYWDNYLDDRKSIITDEQGNPLDGKAAREAFARSLENFVRRLTSLGLHVLIVGGTPHFVNFPLHCIGRAWLFGRSANRCGAIPADAERAGMAVSSAIILDVAARNPGVRTFFPEPLFCDPFRCDAYRNGHLYFRDMHHLSVRGALFVGRALRASLRDWVLQRDERQSRHS